MTSNDPIRLNEVGIYGDLIARPNPDSLVVLTIPPFESMLPFIVQKFGRELTSEEIEIERKKSSINRSYKGSRRTNGCC